MKGEVSRETIKMFHVKHFINMADYVYLQVTTPYNFFYKTKTAVLNGFAPVIYKGNDINDNKFYPVSGITEPGVNSLYKANLGGYNDNEIIAQVTLSNSPLTTIEWYRYSVHYMKCRIIIEGIEKHDEGIMYFDDDANWYDVTECWFIPCGLIEFYNGTLKLYKPIVYYKAGDGYYNFAPGNTVALSSDVVEWLRGNSDLIEDPYGTSPDSKPDGGFGDYDYSGDNIDIPSLPSWSITDSGFVTLYKPSLAQIKSLAQYLWTGIFDLATYKKIFADPMDCIISLSRVPIDADATSTQVLSVGNISTGLTFNVLSSQFVEVSFTSKNIGLRANGFLDYAPYVKVQLYLPFIGMRALSIDDIAGKTLTLKYQIDLFTGACTAYLKCKTKNSDGSEIESVLYQFTGNVLANIPITQANYSSFIQSVISAAAKTGSALISGGAAAAGAAALSSGINVAANIKPDIERSGNMTATGGFLGVKKPYLIVTYPNICKPKNREKTVAIPSFIGLGIQSDNSNLKLSDFKGLTILHKINVKKIPCTEVERQMIETQLTTEGVIM